MIKIFVGCAANNEDLESQAVLHWSLKKHASRAFVICFMQLSRDRASPFYSGGAEGGAEGGWQISNWTTPFSGFRWAVPEICDFSGEAIYMDSDVIVRGDVARLWDKEFEAGKMVIARGAPHPQRLCICKWDCAAAKNWLPKLSDIKADPNSHHFLMKKIAADAKLVQPFGGVGNWNALDLEPGIWAPDVMAVHYTGISTHLGLKHSVPRLAKTNQKHWFGGIPRAHPDQKLQKEFDDLLAEAAEHDYQVYDYQRIPPFGKYGLNRYAAS